MIWNTRSRTIDLSTGTAIMGILNVTPDSFSDGGEWLDPGLAEERARAMVEAGATIVDVGGESTRPGAAPVPADVERERVLPVLRRLCGKLDAALSVDTSKPEVARAAIEAGADIINDVTGLASEAMRRLVAGSGTGAVVMHMRGTPLTMQRAPHYDSLLDEVGDFFRQRMAECLRSGIDPMQLAFDPGIGFGKTPEHNLALVRNLGRVRVEGRPMVLGVSRKSFLGALTGLAAPAERDWPGAMLGAWCRGGGVRVLRVHDVPKQVIALRIADVLGGGLP